MERAGGVRAGTDQSSSGCVVGNGCLLGEPTERGDGSESDGIDMSDAYGDIASTILIFVFFIVAFIWVRRAQKKDELQGTYDNDGFFERWHRQEEDNWRHLQDLHRRSNE